MNAKISEMAPMLEETSAKVIDATVSNLKEGSAKAAATFEVGQTKVTQGVHKAMKTAEEMMAFTQGNAEAVVKSSQIWAAGVQDLSKHVAASAQASIDETFSTFKALTSVRSIKDAFELQAAFARSAMQNAMTDSGKLTDASLRLTEQAMAPITARLTLAVEKFAKTG